MAPDTPSHHSAEPERMCFDDCESFLSTLAIAANAVRIEQSSLRIGGKIHLAAILFDHLRVTTRRAEFRATIRLADSGPKIPTDAEACGRNLGIEDDQIPYHDG